MKIMACVSSDRWLPDVPGAFRAWHTPNDARGTETLGDDAGISIPSVDAMSADSVPLLTAPVEGHAVELTLTPTR